MKKIAIVVLALFCATAAFAAKQPFELIAFDYSELEAEAEESVAIQWSGKLESFLNYNGECHIVLTMTMEDGEKHRYKTEPYKLQGFDVINVTDTFVMPRKLWGDAVTIEVEAVHKGDSGGS